MNKNIREVFIIVLLCVIVIFTIGLLFYDCIPQKNEKIESIEYVADKKVTEALQAIEENNGPDTTNTTEDSLLKSYSIKKDDLNEFVTENYYETGKKDPFAEYSTPIEEEVVKTVTTGNTVNVQAENKVEEQKPENKVENKVEEPKKENKVENTTKEEVKPSVEGKYIEKKNSK